MKFFHKYIKYFYSAFMFLGIILFIVGSLLKTSFLTISAVIMAILGLGIFCYDNWRKVISIYFTYIYLSPREKYEQALRCEEDLLYEQELEMDKAYKKKFYLKQLIRSIFLGFCSLAILIVLVMSIIKMI